MNFESVVSSRRTVYRFLSDEVTLDQVLPALSLSIMAPNHHLTQPWRFLWLGDKMRLNFADIYAKARAKKQHHANSALDLEGLIFKAHNRFMTVPAILMVGCRVGVNEVENEEDFAATCCAINTLLLSLHASGLGAQWSTHPMIKDDNLIRLLGLDPIEMRLAGMIYIGYIADLPPAPPRKHISEFLTVLE